MDVVHGPAARPGVAISGDSQPALAVKVVPPDDNPLSHLLVPHVLDGLVQLLVGVIVQFVPLVIPGDSFRDDKHVEAGVGGEGVLGHLYHVLAAAAGLLGGVLVAGVGREVCQLY